MYVHWSPRYWYLDTFLLGCAYTSGTQRITPLTPRWEVITIPSISGYPTYTDYTGGQSTHGQTTIWQDKIRYTYMRTKADKIVSLI